VTSRDSRYAIRGDLAIDGILTSGAVVVAGGRIEAIQYGQRDGDLPEIVIDAPIVAPGLIDLQVNGGFGVEVGGDAAGLRDLMHRLPETGVTAFLPTLISSLSQVYQAAFSAFDEAGSGPGATMLGFHLEGPYLSPAWKGAHRLAPIEQAKPGLVDELLAGDRVRLMTVAPERPDALALIRRLREQGIVVSLGHTDATHAQFIAGVDAGATMATHLFNAMSSFRHRAPGAAGAALTDDRVTVGLIADGIHSHPASLTLAFRAKGWEQIALVSDIMPAAGMPPGVYEFGGQPVTVDGVSARLADGTLAGAVMTLDGAVRNIVRWTGATPAEAIAMATEIPARVLGLADRGRLTPGSIADFTLFDCELNVVETIIDGERVFSTGHNLPKATPL
jgi:N-acetylglucosamine-6-phosphate deacetylase